MIRGNSIEPEVYLPEHIQMVLTEISSNFPNYFESFLHKGAEQIFAEQIQAYQKEQEAYREYLHLDALDEFEYNAGAFKSHTRKRCPIIRRCLMSQDEVMKAYKKSFNMVTGRQLLDSIRNIANFGHQYAAEFKDDAHENSVTYDALNLGILNKVEYGCAGVIGYGIQSSMLYGVYPRFFAHRSQNAVWALYFLSGRHDFSLKDESEFLMVHPGQGTCEQNYFYPAELFGFYALQVFLMLKYACEESGIKFLNSYRYIYLNAFCDHVGERHREDINIYKRSSDHVESHWF